MCPPASCCGRTFLSEPVAECRRYAQSRDKRTHAAPLPLTKSAGSLLLVSSPVHGALAELIGEVGRRPGGVFIAAVAAG